MTVMEQLYRLQVVDRKLGEVGEQLANQSRLRSLVQLKQREKTCGVQLEQLIWRLQNCRGKVKESEETIATFDAKIDECEKRLYAGANQNLKELEYLESQVTNLRAMKNMLEKDTLEIMQEVEQIEAEVQSIRTEYEELKAECATYEIELKKYRQELNIEEKKLQMLRTQIIDTLPVEIYQHYLKVSRQHDGIAVVKVKQNRCTGCQIGLSPGMISKLRYSEEIEHCEFCGRILFYQAGDEMKRKGVH